MPVKTEELTGILKERLFIFFGILFNNYKHILVLLFHQVLFTGKLWCSLMCFHQPTTPSFFTVKKSEVLVTGAELEKKPTTQN